MPQLVRNMTVTLSRTKETTSYMDSDMRSLQKRFAGLTIVEEDTRHSQYEPTSDFNVIHN